MDNLMFASLYENYRNRQERHLGWNTHSRPQPDISSQNESAGQVNLSRLPERIQALACKAPMQQESLVGLATWKLKHQHTFNILE